MAQTAVLGIVVSSALTVCVPNLERRQYGSAMPALDSRCQACTAACLHMWLSMGCLSVLGVAL
jgi:hypothetical protein